MESPLISIIIPVYNAAGFLKRTIGSVISQTYNNWELILVDDGCGRICDEYSAIDRRITVCHQTNGGVSKARNTGLKNCHGEWCCFVDSDDWLEPEYLNNFLVPGYNKYGCILQSFYVDYEINGKSEGYALPETTISNAAELEYFLEYTDGVHNGYIWHRLFRIQAIRDNKVLFPEGVSFAEDGIFFLNYIQHSELFYLTNKKGYHYIVRQGSLTSRGQKLDKLLSYKLIEGIVAPTYAIIIKCAPSDEIVKGLKKYIWNLIIAWLFERSMTNKEDYYQNISFLNNIQEKYYVDDKIGRGVFLQKSIIRIASMEPSDYNYAKLKFVLFLNKNMQIMKNKFSSIKRRLLK